jgi:hypothetical protein
MEIPSKDFHRTYGCQSIGIASESGQITETVCEMFGFIYLSANFFMSLLIIST